jgi:hypothetical protein
MWGVRMANMRGLAGSMLAVLLIAVAIGMALTIDAPVLAVPVVFMIFVVWAGARLATARGRTI